MRLSADVTVLHYEVDAQIGGKLAQLGARLINSTAKKLAGQFFSSFGEVAGGTVPATLKSRNCPSSGFGYAIRQNVWNRGREQT